MTRKQIKKYIGKEQRGFVLLIGNTRTSSNLHKGSRKQTLPSFVQEFANKSKHLDLGIFLQRQLQSARQR
jgi:hypothetical protein